MMNYLLQVLAIDRYLNQARKGNHQGTFIRISKTPGKFVSEIPFPAQSKLFLPPGVPPKGVPELHKYFPLDSSVA